MNLGCLLGMIQMWLSHAQVEYLKSEKGDGPRFKNRLPPVIWINPNIEVYSHSPFYVTVCQGSIILVTY